MIFLTFLVIKTKTSVLHVGHVFNVADVLLCFQITGFQLKVK